VTRGQLPQRAGSLGLNGGGTATAVPPVRRPRLQMLYLIPARVRINARHNKVGVICKFKNTVSVLNRMQIGRIDNVGCWA